MPSFLNTKRANTQSGETPIGTGVGQSGPCRQSQKAIWGTGSEAERASRQLRIRPYRVFDNDPSRVGRTYFNRTVEGIHDLNTDLDELIVCSMYFIDVVDQILSHGFPPERLSIFFGTECRAYLDIAGILEQIREGRRITEDYRRQHFRGLKDFGADRKRFLRFAMEERIRGGMILEFGVFQGASIRFLATLMHEPVFGFDSFKGLPEDWTLGYPKGTFDLSRKGPRVPPNVSLITGWFADTLDGFLEENGGWLSFLHMDVDLYSSNIFVLQRLGNRIRQGTIIVFDEYLCFTHAGLGDFRAFQDFIAGTGFTYEYLAQSLWRVAVRITSKGPSAVVSSGRRPNLIHRARAVGKRLC